MTGVLVAFSSELRADLAERPGQGKFEKEAAARRRSVLHAVLVGLSRRIPKTGSPAHLRAAVLETPRGPDHQFRSDELFPFSGNFGTLIPVPTESTFAADQPEGYIARFDFPRAEMSVLAAYVELKQRNVLVFHAAVEMAAADAHHAILGSDVARFDFFYAAARDAAMGAA